MVLRSLLLGLCLWPAVALGQAAVHAGLLAYAKDHEQRLPESLAVLYEQGYLKDLTLMVLPETGSKAPGSVAELAAGGGDWSYLGQGVKSSSLEPSRRVILHSPLLPEKRLRVCFLDGTVKALVSESFAVAAHEHYWLITPPRSLAGIKLEHFRLESDATTTLIGIDRRHDATKSRQELHHLSGIEGITVIASEAEWINDEDLRAIAGFPGLRYLYLYHSNISDDGLAAVQAMSTLEGLILRDIEIGDKAMAFVSEMPSLTMLGLQDLQITPKSLPLLAKLHRVSALELDGLLLDDDGLKVLSPLTNLTNFSCHGAIIKGEGFQFHKNLRGLGLKRCQKLSSDGLMTISKLEKLESLSLAQTNIDDAGLKIIAAASKLEEINFSECLISDVGLKHLHKLRSLRRINLAYCPKITVPGILSLLIANKDLNRLQVEPEVGEQIWNEPALAGRRVQPY